ncbi:MAG TPA: M23 family metallopeptidase [Rhizomicrobium sp.]|nr:M23 family metallopeptidase [Rhizomicrobium sp.]
MLSGLAPGQAAAAPVLTIRSMPSRPIIEVRGPERFLNFDMMVTNRTALGLRLSKIELSVYDGAHNLVLRKALNTDAFAPSIAVIGRQILAPGQSLDVFNPFSEFEAAVPLDRLQYSFCLQRENSAAERQQNLHRLPDDCDFQVRYSVSPRSYGDKTNLTLPLRGKIFIWEGHDFYAHHLRVAFANPKVRAMGLTGNSNEFASDFVYTDSDGEMYRGDPRNLENWYGYGKPIYAPGAGTVIAAANDIPDNSFLNETATRIGYPKLPAGKDPKDLGNFVLINHGDGEYSLMLHMKPGSVRVKPGDRVTQGERIGAMGFSGDALFPHLHYTLMAGADVGRSWGIPAYFSHFRRIYGAKSVEVSRGPVNSGDFVESDTPAP